jgi:DNA-binding CsgD family transcriptional regulator
MRLSVEFFERLATARAPVDVLRLLAQEAGALGFPTFAIGALPGPMLLDLPPFFHTNWAPELVDMLRDHIDDDPVSRVATLTTRTVSWVELKGGRSPLRLTAGHRAALALVEEAGVRHGLIVPIHGPHGYRAVASFHGGDGAEPPGARALLHLYALYAHERLRELHAGDARTGAPPPIGPREREALRWMLAGEADEAIAARMGVSLRTVRFHFDSARRKLGCRTRAQALVLAVQKGLIAP